MKRVVPEKKWIPGILFPITSGKNLIQILDPALPYFCSCGVLMVTVLLSSLNMKTFPLQWHHCNPHEYKCQQYQCHDSNHHHAWLRATLLSSGGWAPFLWMWIQNRQQNHLATPFHQKLFFWDKIAIVTLSGSENCLKIFLVWAISVRYSAQFFTKINNFIFCLSASGHLQLFIPIHKS